MEYHRHLDDELNELRDRVLLLGGEAERALERAMNALAERDTTIARDVLEHDDQIDQLEVDVDRQCVDIIALRQPAADVAAGGGPPYDARPLFGRHRAAKALAHNTD